jgi:hypothetical protein
MSTRKGFIEWLSFVGNVHRANKPAVERALQRLADDDQAAATPRRVDDRTKALSCVHTIGSEYNQPEPFDWSAAEDELNRRMDIIGTNGNEGTHYQLIETK